MQIKCAWCEAIGRNGDLGEKPPYENRETTHSICRAHAAALRAKIARMRTRAQEEVQP